MLITDVLALGLDGFVVGATLSATRHGHHEVGLGTILGSNIF